MIGLVIGPPMRLRVKSVWPSPQGKRREEIFGWDPPRGALHRSSVFEVHGGSVLPSIGSRRRGLKRPVVVRPIQFLVFRIGAELEDISQRNVACGRELAMRYVPRRLGTTPRLSSGRKLPYYR